MSREWTVQDLLSWTKSHFEGLGIAEPRLEAEVLLAHALSLDRLGLYIQHDRPANQEERASFREMVREGLRENRLHRSGVHVAAGPTGGY